VPKEEGFPALLEDDVLKHYGENLRLALKVGGKIHFLESAEQLDNLRTLFFIYHVVPGYAVNRQLRHLLVPLKDNLLFPVFIFRDSPVKAVLVEH